MFQYQHIKKRAKAHDPAACATYGETVRHMQKYGKKRYGSPFRQTFIIY